ncbi:TPA: AfsA-related hotdog domain-containing protein [Citrobacter braakii]|uniref:AfsA-related hotdog domain-containing protein n=1 Tax=Citrobacter sp. Cb031 TaxID=2985025 RepID=UPI0025799B83|nr:AfsA-related hotdog domain-containing protein [Citrobacter sp. Cb031]MDM3464670.1 hypothetical protein [Citrobacter sp. Cb031]
MKNIKLYTHKKNAGEIFITNTSRVSDNHFQADFKLVPDHHFYSDCLTCSNRINPLFLLECARQAETYLSHAEFGIALDNKFLLDNWSITYYPSRSGITENLKADIYTKHPTINKTIKNEFEITFKLNGTIIGTVTIEVRYITSHCYTLIRRTPDISPPTRVVLPLTPDCVCYTKPENAILADLNDKGPYVNAIINIDKSNKSLNDHEQDHITGMNLTEAAKQICYSYLSIYMHEKIERFILVELDGHFFSYVGKNIPTIVIIKKVELQNGIYSFDVDVTQNEKTLATVNLKLRGEYE